MEQDDTSVVTYLFGQHSNLYFSLVKMWDRLYGYVFVNKKDQLPHNVGIGDIYSGQEVGFDDANYDAIRNFTWQHPDRDLGCLVLRQTRSKIGPT
jgi:hypothetical protein